MMMTSCPTEFSKSDINDLIKFLSSQKKEVRAKACEAVSQLTGTKDGLEIIYKEEKLLCAVLLLVRDENTDISKDALRTLINVSAEDEGCSAIFSLRPPEPSAVKIIIECIEDADYYNGDLVCGVLANMTRSPLHCKTVFDYLMSIPLGVNGLVIILCQFQYNKKGGTLHHLAAVIANLSQIKEGRCELMNETKNPLLRFIDFCQESRFKLLRKSSVAAIHNCCFELEYQEWLLSEKMEIASRLLIYIAGPDTFTEEENDTLPTELQYLSSNKEREEDPEIRALVLEGLMQLCATKRCRTILRKINIYLILREHHKWEKEEKCSILNEDIANLLLKTEEEIGEDDLTAVNVPTHIADKFSNLDFN